MIDVRIHKYNVVFNMCPLLGKKLFTNAFNIY